MTLHNRNFYNTHWHAMRPAGLKIKVTAIFIPAWTCAKKKQVTKVLKVLDTYMYMYMHMFTSREHALYMYILVHRHVKLCVSCTLSSMQNYSPDNTVPTALRHSPVVYIRQKHVTKSILFTSRQHSSFPVLVFCVKRKRQHSAKQCRRTRVPVN